MVDEKSSLNNQKKCFLRDNIIMEYIDYFGVLNTKQIYTLVALHQTSGYRIVQRRMKSLVKRKKVKVIKDSPYVYYIDKKLKFVEHRIMTNWGYIFIKLYLLDKFEQIVGFSVEDDYGILRSDGFVTIKNPFTNKYRFIFIETDLSNNTFDKIKKYNQLYANELYTTKDWYKIADRFPEVLILTHRITTVKNKIIVENKYGLEFKVYDIKEVLDKF